MPSSFQFKRQPAASSSQPDMGGMGGDMPAPKPKTRPQSGMGGMGGDMPAPRSRPAVRGSNAYTIRDSDVTDAIKNLRRSNQGNVTSTPVDTAAPNRQLQRMRQQSQQAPPSPAPPPSQPPMQQKVSPRSWGWANQTNPQPPQAGPLSAPMSNVSTSFNNATGQQDPPHIITTDNGRKFNTQTKQFLDGRLGGFAR